MIRNLLPEEDALDDSDDDDEADPSLPGDLWFRNKSRVAMKTGVRGMAMAPSYTRGRLCCRRLENRRHRD
jgi:hypothetical protein